MALEMRESCEKRDRALGLDAEAFVCSTTPGSSGASRRARICRSVAAATARAKASRVRQAFPDWPEAVEDMITEGSKVVTRYASTGAHRGAFRGIAATGATITVPEISIDSAARGEVLEQWCLLDELGRLQQLGTKP